MRNHCRSIIDFPAGPTDVGWLHDPMCNQERATDAHAHHLSSRVLLGDRVYTFCREMAASSKHSLSSLRQVLQQAQDHAGVDGWILQDGESRTPRVDIPWPPGILLVPGDEGVSRSIDALRPGDRGPRRPFGREAQAPGTLPPSWLYACSAALQDILGPAMVPGVEGGDRGGPWGTPLP